MLECSDIKSFFENEPLRSGFIETSHLTWTNYRVQSFYKCFTMIKFNKATYVSQWELTLVGPPITQFVFSRIIAQLSRDVIILMSINYADQNVSFVFLHLVMKRHCTVVQLSMKTFRSSNGHKLVTNAIQSVIGLLPILRTSQLCAC